MTQNSDKIMMKAVVCPRYGPPEVLRLTTVPKPTPKPHEVLVRVRATTVTVADYRIRGFNVPKAVWIPARLAIGITSPRQPILGVEMAGDVEAVGSAVTRFKAGDAVFAATLFDRGSYAEYKCVNQDGAIALKPVNLTYEEAATIPIGARTALHFLRKGNVQSGQSLLVYGASGSVGSYAVQLGKHFGATVTGVCSAANLELVKSLGANEVLDYRATNFSQQLGQYDALFIAVDQWPFDAASTCLKPGGVYINITNPIKSFAMMKASRKHKQRFVMGGDPPDSGEHLDYLRDLAEKGAFRPLIDRTYPVEQIVEAHRYVEAGHKKGNVAITLA